MSVELAADLLRLVLTTCLTLIAPIMGTAIGIGVLVSLLQSVTSIQEQTLTFVPKLVGVAFVLILTSHWMIRSLTEFGTSFIQRMPEMAP
jgi:flagellar biosynthetic protein FliQ